MSSAIWLQAARPKTLVAGIVPVAVGSALALRDGAFLPIAAGMALLGALLIQIGTNLTNDYFDFVRGADTADRLGPPRVTQQGLLSPKAVKAGALLCFALAIAVGLYLVAVGGWPILVIGIASVLAGYAYTGGPFPLGYHGLGDVFVLVFFGLVAVGGTYFLQAQALTATALMAAIPVGTLGVALLAVNNVRDAATDARAGKKTLVVRFGTGFGRAEWVAMVALAFATPIALWVTGAAGDAVLLPLLALPLVVAPFRLVRNRSGVVLNTALAATARLQLVFGLLFAVGLAR
ncbi:MAG: 1,4-dihydroxy-2-naphthoate octaprenyltransferase [Myxococcaceae bacterium]|nr:1,4-dihydroxy-2-naphthoate octaprenyltransferase [Myxococcaceae bacterium]